MSYRLTEQQEADLREKVEALPPTGGFREIAMQMVSELLATGKMRTLDLLQAPPGYDRKPVTMKQFLEDSDYLGHLSEDLWPAVKADLIHLFDSGKPYVEVILGGSIGAGKSFFVGAAYTRMLYELSCLQDPAVFYGLAPGSRIVLINQSVTRDLAKRVLFEDVKEMVERCPYFKEFCPTDTFDSNQLSFPSKRIVVLPVASNETSALGLNVFGGCIDEINFLPKLIGSKKSRSVNEIIDVGQRMYNAISKRLRSRFVRTGGSTPGKLFLVSSARYDDDFTERKRKEAAFDPMIFPIFRSTWESKPRPDMKDPNSKWTWPGFRVEVGGVGGRPRILTGSEDPAELTGRIVEIPQEYRKDFDRDLTSSVRDIAGLPTSVQNPFLSDIARLAGCTDKERLHPFTSTETTLQDGVTLMMERLAVQSPEGKWSPRYFPGVMRYGHIDYAETTDELGLAIGCSPYMIEVERRNMETGLLQKVEAPYIHIDLMLRVLPPPGGSISFSDARAFFYTLMDRGFSIARVTSDSFQSTESRQEFLRRGIRSDTLSVDKDMGPYVTWREAVLEYRCHTYEYPPYFEEAGWLEIDRARRKVDHPHGKDKGVTDAVASVCHQVTEAAMGGLNQPIVISKGQDVQQTPEEQAQEEFKHEVVESRVQKIRVDLIRGQAIPWETVGPSTLHAAGRMLENLLQNYKGANNFPMVRFLIDEQIKWKAEMRKNK